VLPYLASQSPLTKVQTGLAYDATEDGEAAWRDTLVGLGLAILLSVLLGTPAVLLSLLAILASVGIRHRVRHGKRPAFMTALLGTGLPWALGAALGWTGDALPPAEHSGAGLLLGAGFTCLTWFVYRVDVDDSRGDLGQIWVGQAVVLVILIVLREAVGLAMVGSLLAVSFLWMSQRQYSREEVLETLNNCDPWWLACMLASALAVRF
jgi:hypothetical protein